MRKPAALAALFAVVTLATACATLRSPTEADLPRAQAHFPGVTLNELSQGRAVYAARCSGCHPLHTPEARTASQWHQMVAEMKGDAHLTDEEVRLVEQYLVTFARDESGGGGGAVKSRYLK